MGVMLDQPLIFRVRQKLDSPVLADIPGEVEAQLSGLSLGTKVQPGQTVAISNIGIYGLSTRRKVEQ